MSILNRPDGVQFITQAYRERLPVGKRSVLVQRIRQLSEQHGNYVLIYPLRPAVLEAVFSRESGCLLGETLWNYFERPPYLIFCERLTKENNQVLLVVIRNNEVYLDTVVENDKLRAELLPLMTMQESFRVITYGEVSLSQTDSPSSFVLPKNLVQSFEIAKEPVFRNLPVLASCRLLSLALTLRSPLLGPRFSPAVIAAATLAVIAGVWAIYIMHPPTVETVVVTKTAEKETQTDYGDFYAAMNTPGPRQQLSELAQSVKDVYALTGWQASAIRYTGSQYQVQLARQGGTMEWLMHWANDHHYPLALGANDVQVVLPSHLTNRPRPAALYALPPIVASLIDQLDRSFPTPVVSLGEAKMLGKTQSRMLTINLPDVSPDILELLGNILGDNSPLAISAMDVNIRAGLLSGSIQLSVWGT